MIDISRLSGRYGVRRLRESEADRVLELCRENTQFYEYCEAEPTREQVLSDMRLLPPGIGPEDKYYFGFFQEDALIAVMDLVDGYPEAGIAFMGFFMMKKAFQGRGEGTAIIREAASGLKAQGKTAIRLAIDKGNPQSTHFWKKNGFDVIMEVDRNGWTALVAERKL